MRIAASLSVGLVMALCVGGCGAPQPMPGDQLAALERAALSRAAERQAAPAVSAGRCAAGRHDPAERLSVLRGDGAADGSVSRAALAWSGSPHCTILSAPSAEAADAEGPAAKAETSSPDRWWQRPLAGRMFGEVVREDISQFPRELWKSTRDTATVPSLLILGAAGGLSAISRGSWDHRVDRSLREHDGTIFDHEGDFGSVIGSPFLHAGLALAAYGYSVQAGNEEMYGFSKTLLQALVLNAMVTSSLKVAANDYSPNHERYAWPSGHTSSTATVAAVAWEYYGWKAGVPLYLLTGWVAASRLDDREHWLSDVIFGAALGSVIGHSVARGRTLEVAGFTVLPYVHPEGGAGILLAKPF